MSKKIYPVVLCGGNGTRLWPLSRKAFPKQFVPLLGAKSLIQLTLERMAILSDEVLTVAADDHRFLMDEAAGMAGVRVRQILEPAGKNTAPAMAAAALQSEPDALLLFTPADHHIPDNEGFAAAVRSAIPAAESGRIVTFGVVPSFPSTGYGYIQRGAHSADLASYDVVRFIEKPDAQTATQLLLDGAHLWNAGVFLVKAGTLLSELARHAPDILESCQTAIARATVDGAFTRLHGESFRNCRGESIDYALLEKSDSVSVVPLNTQWSDVGSWNAVAALGAADADGNRSTGKAVFMDAKDTYVHAPHRPVVALGTSNLVVVDTPDAILVAASSEVERVKDVVAVLARQNAVEATHHRRTARPWGVYDSVDTGERFQVKRITVKPGAQLSLQMHHHRAEHWIVVKGTAKVTCGEETFLVAENESTYIPLGTKHRLENPGRVPLELIEVQSGSYLGEDDIVRFEDTYGRAN